MIPRDTLLVYPDPGSTPVSELVLLSGGGGGLSTAALKAVYGQEGRGETISRTDLENWGMVDRTDMGSEDEECQKR